MASESAGKSAFHRLWDTNNIREKILAKADRQSLINLRLVCKNFSKRTTGHVFKDTTVTFRSTTFTKPARLAALKRIGCYVRRLTFSLSYCLDTLLPPLLEPTTGTEVEFVYTPDCELKKPESSHSRLIGQDDASKELSSLLIQQYPPLYHAAVNVPSFINAFACLPNIKYLIISCPSEDSVVPSSQSIVDYALISLRIAIERSVLKKLDHLTLAPIQPHVIKLLNPVFGPGARPNSLRRWRQIRNLTVKMPLTSASTQLKQLHNYLNALSPNLQSFVFHWLAPHQKPSSRNSMTYSGKPARPSSTDTSYFPSIPAPEIFHRGANPLTLHLSSFLRSRAPRQKASAHSLPSMTSKSTLNSIASAHSSSSAGSPPSTSPTRQQQSPQRPKLRCQPELRRMSTSSPTSSRSTSPASPTTGMRALSFPKLSFFELDSISCAATEVAAFVEAHGTHLSEFRLEHMTLEPGGGDWDDALAPLTRLAGGDERWRDHSNGKGGQSLPSRQASSARRVEEEVPICLGPELSPLSPIDLKMSPIRFAGGVDAAVKSTMTTPDVALPEPRIIETGPDVDISAEIGIDFDDAHIAEIVAPTPMLLGEELHPKPLDINAMKGGPGLPWASVSPLLAMKDGMARPYGAPAGYYGGGVGMGRGTKLGAKLPTSQRVTQRALEDGVRKLLAQTVFPWF